MTSRTSLPATLASPVLSKSAEGVTFRQPSSVVPVSKVSPVIPESQPPVAATAPVTTPPTDQKKVSSGYTFNPLIIVVLILVFIIVFVILFATKTNLVTDLVNGQRVINNGKVVFWTVLISIIISVIIILGVTVWGKKSKK